MLFKIINGKDICLRPLDDSCCSEKYVDWMNNIDINKYLEARWVSHNCESVKAFIKEIENSDHSIIFGIFRKIDSVHIGNIKIGPINKNHSFADIGYIIGEQSAWGCGFSTEAVKIVVNYAFKDLGLNKCTAGVYASNNASSRVLEKAGFVEEGRFKRHLKSGNGWEDHIAYGILNPNIKK